MDHNITKTGIWTGGPWEGFDVAALLKGNLLINPNLIINSSGYNGTSNWNGTIIATDNGYKGAKGFICKRTDNSSTSRTFITQDATNRLNTIPQNSKITFSGWYYINSADSFTGAANPFIRWTDSAGSTDTGFTIGTSEEKDKWIYFEKTFTVSKNPANCSNITITMTAFSQGISTITFSNFKIEIGDKATPWIPHINDIYGLEDNGSLNSPIEANQFYEY